jgi:hypothetical protein
MVHSPTPKHKTIMKQAKKKKSNVGFVSLLCLKLSRFKRMVMNDVSEVRHEQQDSGLPSRYKKEEKGSLFLFLLFLNYYFFFKRERLYLKKKQLTMSGIFQRRKNCE